LNLATLSDDLFTTFNDIHGSISSDCMQCDSLCSNECVCAVTDLYCICNKWTSNPMKWFALRPVSQWTLSKAS